MPPLFEFYCGLCVRGTFRGSVGAFFMGLRPVSRLRKALLHAAPAAPSPAEPGLFSGGKPGGSENQV